MHLTVELLGGPADGIIWNFDTHGCEVKSILFPTVGEPLKYWRTDRTNAAGQLIYSCLENGPSEDGSD